MRKLNYYTNHIKNRCSSYYIKNIYSSKVKEQFAILYDEKKMQEALQHYYMSKIKMCILAGVVGSVLIGMIAVNTMFTNQIDDNMVIERNEYGEGIKGVDVNVKIISDAQDDEDIEGKMTVEVAERSLTKIEIEEGFEKVTQNISTYILGENEDLENITKPMNLVTSFSEYPFIVEWQVDDYSLIQVDGSLGIREPAEDGELVKLTATISYKDLERDVQLFIVRKLPIQSVEESIMNELNSELKITNEKTSESSYMELPTELQGKVVVWEEKKDSIIPGMLLLLLLLIIGIYYGKDIDIDKQVRKREEQLKDEYCNIVSKLVMLMGAGMTIRGSLMRIGNEYKQQKEKGHQNIAYEEILITCNQIATGISEKDAYYNWGKRCRISTYRKLTMLLIQNLKKGTVGLLDILYQENEKALEDRKIMARKKGEEAGTKLLLPMVMMLSVVMIMIIVPAYLSFSI